ncbi:MAG: T9SS C-terminal target domain-containing protein [Bacteroidetes bacterium]|nr:MAG: T9SS C-terminal target domain-containing protein [Bacteroidota bacterium]
MKPISRIFLILLFSLSIHALAQKQFNDLHTGNRDGMMWFNLSSLNWIEAFDSLHVIMEERYPFTEWKGIDWDQKLNLTRPKIQEAQNEGNFVMLTGALLEYLLSIPDGHITMLDFVKAFNQARQAGSFGLNMIPITDGSVVVNIVPEWGPAYLAGLRCGDEILSWNGTPILEVPEMEVYNNPNGVSANYATEEGRLISRYMILSRDSISATIDLSFISHETGSQHTATLQVGYLHVQDEDAPDSLTLEEIRQTAIYDSVKSAITYFNEQSIDKLVFDLRHNNGGNDLMGSAISGFFIESPMFYEYITGTSDDNYTIIDSIITVPETPKFNGEVVVMVSPKDISTGEGIPMMLQRLHNARVISFWGTNGSFGIIPNVVIMPDSLQFILFPYARSLDQDQVIQLDSDSLLLGGVQPDIKIPLTVERVIEQWPEGKDVELEYAISMLLDIPEFEQQKVFRIYPNPADAAFRIEYNSENPMTIRITDVSGRLVRVVEHFTSGQAIDINDLRAGLYFVAIDDNQRYFVEKLLELYQNQSTLDAMLTWTELSGGTYGLGISKHSQQLGIGHDGETVGFISFASVNPETGSAIVFSYNQHNREFLGSVVPAIYNLIYP